MNVDAQLGVQSSSTSAMLTTMLFSPNLTTSSLPKSEPNLHTINKRNTMENHKQTNKLKRMTTHLTTSEISSAENSVASTTTYIGIIGPAEWLKPFDFKFVNRKRPSKKNMSATTSRTTSTISTTASTVSAQMNFTTAANLSYDQNVQAERAVLKQSQGYLNRKILNPTTEISEVSTRMSIMTMSKTDHERLTTKYNFNINDYLSCERNLTRLTVYYKSVDVLTCMQISNRTTLMKCIDEILETKLMLKLGYYYYSQRFRRASMTTQKMTSDSRRILVAT